MDEKTAKEIVEKIVADLSSRRGLGQEWDQIDEDIQDEIQNEWIQIILQSTNLS